MKTTIAFIIISTLSLMSCGKNDEEKLIHETAYNFSDKLFNYKYAEALTLATPESRRTIEFLASNLDEKAIEYLHGVTDTPSVAVEAIEIINDTSATATVCVTNETALDSIGKAMSVHHEKRTYTFKLVRIKDKWHVKMEDLRQNEK